MKQYFDWGGFRGKGTGLRLGNMTKQTQTSCDTTEHCALGATGLLISSLWMWDFPLCPQPGMWSSSPGYQFCFPTFNKQRNSYAKDDGCSFDSGNYALSQELANQSSLLSTKTCLNLLRDGLFGKKQRGHRFQVAVSLLELWAPIVLWKNQVKEKAAKWSFSFTVLLS